MQVSSRQGVQQLLPPELTFVPVRWSCNCAGGPKAAEIQVAGGQDAIKQLRQWLRYPVKIVATSGTVVWWGYVHEVEMQVGGLTIVASLDRLRNRVKVLYTQGNDTSDTGWADHAISQAEYGYKEHVESLGDANSAMATALQTRLLADGANPKLKRSLAGEGTTKAILRCLGWYQRLSWKYYQRLDGRVENAGTGNTVMQPIGWGVSASSNIGTGDNALFAVGDYFNYFSAGHRLVVTGCTNASNNQTYTVAGSTSDEVVTHTHTLSFEIDDINDPAGDLSGFKEEYWVWVSGSVQNDRFHWIGKADNNHIEVKQQIAGELDPEGPTSNVTLTQPQKLSVLETNYTEAPSSGAKTVVHKGQRVAQKVTLATGMYVSAVQLDVGKAGSPADNLNVQIYTDVAGTPTTLKTTGSLAGSAITGDDLTTTWLSVTKVWLAAGDYWIITWRSGSLDAVNHFLVGMVDAAYLTTKQWDGSVWTTMEPAWSLKFRLWGVDDIGTLAETLIAASQQGLTLSTGYTASVDGYTYMESNAVALDELERLLNIGTATGERILLDLSPDLSVRLSSRADFRTVPNLALYTANGRQQLTDAVGSAVEPGANVASQWVRLADLDSELAADSGLSPAWIEEAEYDATNGKWSLTFEGERSIVDLIKVQQG